MLANTTLAVGSAVCVSSRFFSIFSQKGEVNKLSSASGNNPSISEQKHVGVVSAASLGALLGGQEASQKQADP